MFNENGVIFFAAGKQHRDMQTAGISYEDNYKGNALAALLSKGMIEIRYHREFPDGRVSAILDPCNSFNSDFRATVSTPFLGRRF